MTLPDGLPNHWNLFNLRESPYFQGTLGKHEKAHPISLFVGRSGETLQLLGGIGGSRSSRQAIGGAPGVGKTTLVQLVKATAVANGYWATNGVISCYPDDTAERMMGRILEGIYEAVLTARPHTSQHQAMQTAQQYVRAFRMAGGSGNISIAGFGAGMSASASAVTPAGGLLMDGPRLVRELLDLATENAKGVVVHLDNLENLSERGIANAADTLRSLRDTVLLQEGLHVLLVGTAEAVTASVSAHAQLRSVFSVLVIDPLPVEDVLSLLDARYQHLALSQDRPVTPPVEPEAVKKLYPLFRGDLRGLLKAMEDGVALLVGMVGTEPSAPITLGDLRPALRRQYAEQLTAALKPVRQQQLKQWADQLGADATPTQEQLVQTWKLTQPAVSQALRDVIQAGYVTPLPKRGGEATTYSFTGAGQIIFG
jgi:hypothetical protein